MPLLLPGLDEPTFLHLSQRVHRGLKPHLTAVSLGQLRELMSQALGYRSLHDARQAWQSPRAAGAAAEKPEHVTPRIETYDRLHKCPVILTNDRRGCGYQGYEFGANYLDSVCIDGFLWDADSGGPGENLMSGGDQPCPWCNHEAWVEGCLETLTDDGFDAQSRGVALSDNPHPANSRFHHLEAAFAQAWAQGWQDAATQD